MLPEHPHVLEHSTDLQGALGLTDAITGTAATALLH